MGDLFVARQSGTVMLDGRRHSIRRGVTVAREGSDMLAKHGKLFKPLRVHYESSGKASRRAPVEQATAAPGEVREVAVYRCDRCEATAKSPAGLAAHKRTHAVAEPVEE